MLERINFPLPWKGIFAVIGAFLGNLTLGSLGTFGNMSPYISSYMTVKLGLKLDASDMAWVHGAAVAGQGTLMVAGGILERKFGARKTALLGCVLMSLGVSLTYFTVDVALYAVVLTYGVANGLGVSIAYIAFLQSAVKWFPERHGLFSGIIVSAFGLGPLLINPVQTQFLNPRNVHPNKEGIFTQDEVLDKVPNLFLVLGCLYATVQLVACVLLSKEPANPFETQNNTTKTEDHELTEGSLLYNPKSKTASDNDVPSLTPLQVAKTREFYLLWLTFLFNNVTYFFFSTMYKAYGQTFIRDDHFLSMIGAVGAMFNCGGRCCWGILSDTYSHKVLMQCLCIGVLVLTLTGPATSLGGKYVFGTSYSCVNIFLSGTFVLMPICVKKTFGAEHAGANYGMVFSNAVIGGFVSALLTQQLTSCLGYTGMFYTLSGLSVCSFLLTLPFRENQQYVQCEEKVELHK